MHTTPKAIEIENETLKNIVDSFFNENSKFLKNLDSVKGIGRCLGLTVEISSAFA